MHGAKLPQNAGLARGPSDRSTLLKLCRTHRKLYKLLNFEADLYIFPWVQSVFSTWPGCRLAMVDGFDRSRSSFTSTKGSARTEGRARSARPVGAVRALPGGAVGQVTSTSILLSFDLSRDGIHQSFPAEKGNCLGALFLSVCPSARIRSHRFTRLLKRPTPPQTAHWLGCIRTSVRVFCPSGVRPGLRFRRGCRRRCARG